jgi:hypothetical protein
MLKKLYFNFKVMHPGVLNYKIKNILVILYLIVQHNWIYDFKTKNVITSQANDGYKYKNTKRKLRDWSAHIFFNQHCLRYGLTPKKLYVVML